MSEPTRRKPGPKRGPRVDDSLVQRHQARSKIEALLRRNMGQRFREKALASLANRILAVSPAAQAILLDMYLDNDNELGHMALLVLAETPQEETLRRVDEHLDRGHLSQQDALRLMMVKTFIKDDPDQILQELSRHGDPNEVLGRMAGEMWKKLEPEEAAMLWLEQYGALEPQDRIALLSLFLEAPCRGLLGVARIEARSDNADIQRLLAERLADFPYPETVPVLEQLCQSANMGVRLAAEHSLGALRSNLPDLFSAEQRGASFGQGQFYEAYVARDPLSGQYSVIYSQKAADGSIGFCVALIDTWDQGLMDIWGNVGFSPREFHDLIESFGPASQTDDKDFRYEPAEKDFALQLLRGAEALSSLRGYELPTEMPLWSDLYAAEPAPSGPSSVAFGLQCLECGAAIRRPRSAQEKNAPLIFGDFALCGACLKRKTCCAACGKKVKRADAAIVANLDSARADLFCRDCFERSDRGAWS